MGRLASIRLRKAGEFMILNDKEIQNLNCISPFVPCQIKMTPFDATKRISYGLSSFGYDIVLSDDDIRVFKGTDVVIDPKNFDFENLLEIPDTFLNPSSNQTYFILPPSSCALGVSKELFKIPSNVLGVCIGKSTYARCGIIVNITPLEPNWEGRLTIEISNTSRHPCKIYLNEGIAQIVFLKGETPMVTYDCRKGKYQNQGGQTVPPKV